MKTLAAFFALAGAALLFWRTGGAIGAEVAYEMRSLESQTNWWAVGMLWLCAGAIPMTMAAAVYASFRYPNEQNLRRLAIAAGVGLYFLLPAILRWFGLRPSPGPIALWPLVSYLAYRFVINPKIAPSGPPADVVH